MRVTQQMVHGNVLNNINKNLTKLDHTQQQISTGKELSKPSDDPIKSVDVLKYRNAISSNAQYQRNVDNAITWLDTIDTALDKGINIIHRSKELTIQAASGTMTPEDRSYIAKEIDELLKEMKSIANTSINGKFVFNGQRVDTAPFSKTDSYLNQTPLKGSVISELSKGATVPLNLEAEEAFGSAGESIFETLEGIRDGLKNDDDNALENGVNKLGNNLDGMLSALSDIGARKERTDLINNRLIDEEVNIKRMLSQSEDADLAKAIMTLKLEEQVYQASLSASAKIMQMSLMDYLR